MIDKLLTCTPTVQQTGSGAACRRAAPSLLKYVQDRRTHRANERPGKLLKFGTACGFALAAATFRLRRALTPAYDLTPHLVRDERLRGEWRRHWIHAAPAMTAGVLATLGLGWLAGHFAGSVSTVALLVLAWVVVLTWCGWRLAVWQRERLVLTDRRLIVIDGATRRQVATLPLLRVTDMVYEQSPSARLLNYAVFRLDTADPTAPGADFHVKRVPHPHRIYLRIVEEMCDAVGTDDIAA